MAQQGIEFFEIPEEVAALIRTGQVFYKIDFISPASRTMKAEELQGIFQTMEFLAGVSQIDPQSVLRFDADKSVGKVAELSGAPMELIRDDETVQAMIQAQQKALQEQAERQAATEEANIAKTESQVETA